MGNEFVALACFALTVALYLASKRLNARLGTWWSSPMIVVPLTLIAVLVGARIPYDTYFHDTRWLTWLLGPATVAFAVPIYEHRALIRRHWLSLASGVLVGMPVAVVSSIWLARELGLPQLLQNTLATRSVSTPFALAAAPSFGGQPELAAVFVVLTGVCGMLIGEAMLAVLPVRSRLAKGALFGAAAHGVGTAKAREIGAEEGVVASLTMMFGGLATVLAAPLVAGYV
ncbi:putative effector of murein hydrolase [Crenobacter luteus]|uniref:Murein hydrolase effector protein LrgB n=1 Tax=Crenobacter luteus TaxID=1452487 RepID=A0A161R6X0_9NEIS|nr:LrgB family protein [Crenobacter luteus]KZE31808.1 murein hydrolase effector protein LrgB [Crenobacter luteus]TCP15677.1 putative effector of murein hydrolase [Crenobacter luteus]